MNGAKFLEKENAVRFIPFHVFKNCASFTVTNKRVSRRTFHYSYDMQAEVLVGFA